MTHVLGRIDQRATELDRTDEVTAVELLRDRVPLALPAVEFRKPRLDLGV